MITIKYAYIKLTNLDYKLQNIEDCINEGKLLTAYHILEQIRGDVESMKLPFYQTLTNKQRKELLDGWTPDTQEGSYIEIKPKYTFKFKSKTRTTL